MKSAVLILILLSYGAFFAVSWKANKGGYLKFVDGFGSIISAPLKLIAAHLAGIFILGIVPIGLLKNRAMELLECKIPIDVLLLVAYCLCFLLLLAIAFKEGEKVFEKMCQVTVGKVALPLRWMVTYFIVRFVFLIVYEFWFRGLLLFACVDAFGVLPAILINIVVYVLAHVFSGKKEMLACIPFGVLACFFSLMFHSFWPAVLLHLGFSFVYEYAALWFSRINFKIQWS